MRELNCFDTQSLSGGTRFNFGLVRPYERELPRAIPFEPLVPEADPLDGFSGAALLEDDAPLDPPSEIADIVVVEAETTFSDAQYGDASGTAGCGASGGGCSF